MYIKLTNGIIEKYPYSYGQLQADNPGTSFPVSPTNELLAEWGVYPVASAPQPTVPPNQNVSEGVPKNVGGIWQQTWLITDKTPEQIAQYNQEQKQNRLYAYEREADPLFFKWQRGEATEQEWLDKVAEIKARFPKE